MGTLDAFTDAHSVAGSSTALSTGSLTITTTQANDVICVVMGTWEYPIATPPTLDGVAMTAQIHTPTTSSGAYVTLYDAVAASSGSHTIAYNFGSPPFGITAIVAYAISGVAGTGAEYAVVAQASPMSFGSSVAAGTSIVSYQQINGAYPPAVTTSGLGTFVSEASFAFGNENSVSADFLASATAGAASLTVNATTSAGAVGAAYPPAGAPAATGSFFPFVGA